MHLNKNLTAAESEEVSIAMFVRLPSFLSKTRYTIVMVSMQEFIPQKQLSFINSSIAMVVMQR